MADKKSHQNPVNRQASVDSGHAAGEALDARIGRGESQFRSTSGSVDSQAKSSIAASVIGLGLAGQIATDQGQASVTGNAPEDVDLDGYVHTASVETTATQHQEEGAADAGDGVASNDTTFEIASLGSGVSVGLAQNDTALSSPGFAKPLGQAFHQPELTATSLDPSRPVSAAASAPASAAPTPAGHATTPVMTLPDEAEPVEPTTKQPEPDVDAPPTEPVITDNLTPTLHQILSQGGLLQPVTDLLEPVLGEDGLVDNLVETVVQPILDPLLGPDGLLDVVLGEDGILAPVTDLLQPVLGEDGLVGQIIGSVNPVLDNLLGQGGLLAPVTDILAPVLSPDGVVGQVVATVNGVLDPIVDAVLTPVTDVLAPVLGKDGVVEDVVETVTDAIEPVLGGLLAPVTGILAPAPDGTSNAGGLAGGLSSLLGGLGLSQAHVPPSAAETQDAPENLIAPATDTLQSVAAPLVAEGGVIDTLVGDGGLLGGLVGGLLGAGPATTAPHTDVAQPDVAPTNKAAEVAEPDFLDTLIGTPDLGDAPVLGDVPSIMDLLLSDAPLDLSPSSDGAEDLLASVFDIPDLSGLLIDAGLMNGTAEGASTGHVVETDADVDSLLNEIMDSAERPLAGVIDPVDALLDFDSAETGAGIFADATVENALGIILGEEAVDTDIHQGSGVPDALIDLASVEEQP